MLPFSVEGSEILDVKPITDAGQHIVCPGSQNNFVYSGIRKDPTQG